MAVLMSITGEKLRKRDDFGSIERQLALISENIEKKVVKGQAEHRIAGVKIAKTPEIRISFQKNMGQAKAAAEKLRECLDKGTPDALNRWA
jgi:hypothetical protein